MLSYVANVYVLMLGFTLGFLSSVPASSIGSVLHSDRASRFLEVLLSTPTTVERYIAIVTTVSLVGGFISFSLVALVYTLSLGLAGSVAKAIMLSGWVYVVTLLVTVFTSLFNTVLFLVAMKVSIDLSRLSMIPSTVLFLFIIVSRNLGLEALDNRYLYVVVASLALAVLALGALTVVMTRRLKSGQLLFSIP